MMYWEDSVNSREAAKSKLLREEEAVYDTIFYEDLNTKQMRYEIEGLEQFFEYDVEEKRIRLETLKRALQVRESGELD